MYVHWLDLLIMHNQTLVLIRSHGTTLAQDNLSLSEKNECRYRLNAKWYGKCPVLIYIELDDANSAFKFFLVLLKYWVHCLSGAALYGKEVDLRLLIE